MNVMNLAEIMDKSIEILKKNLKNIVLFNLAYGIITFIGVFIIAIIGIIFGAITIGLLHLVALPVVVFTIAGVLILAFSLTLKVGMINIASQEFSGEQVTSSNAIGISFKSVLKVLGITVLVILMFLPVIAAFGAVGYFMYTGMKGHLIFLRKFTIKEIGIIILPVLLMLAFIIILAIYLNLFVFSLHAMTIEKKGVISSLKRSYELVKSNFWRIFGCTLMVYLTYYAIITSLESFIGIILGLIYLLMKLFNVAIIKYTLFITSALTYLRWPINILSWLVISPVITNMITVLYFNQRFKKEGFDIELKLKKIQRDEQHQLDSSAGTSIE